MRVLRSPTKFFKFLAVTVLAGVLIIQVLSSIVAYNTSAFFEGGSGSPNNAPGTLIELQTQTKGVGESQLLNSSHAIYKELPKVKMSPAAPSASSDTELEKHDTSVALSGQRIHGLPALSNESLVPSLKSRASKTAGSEANGEDKTMSDSDRILERINILNEDQSVRNEDVFGAVDNRTLAVIVVQVHNRIQYLRQLVISFSQARDIEKTLLVFSHDFWDPEINDLVASIDFAKTLQIFYPFSIQTHQNTFPGESKNDCPRNAKKHEAVKMRCTNAEWPDLYGHYREAKFTQTKHHWWWKANRIFNELRSTKYYDGYVLFLEEDHYVAEDFLHVLNLLREEREKKKDVGDIICLGTYLKHAKAGADTNWVEISQWISSKHNMGMAFDRSLWSRLHACTEHFCNFDDYNWDWSLYHVSLKCLKRRLQVVMVSGPRVFHIGECGVHHKKSECTTSKVVSKVQQILAKAKPYLFPDKLQIKPVTTPGKMRKAPNGNGGWGDHRDRKMCVSLSETNATLQLSEQIETGRFHV